MEDQQQRKLGCRVILFPKPYVGHITPMLHLGNALHSKGFSITIIQTRFNAPDPTKFPNFTFHYIEDALSKAEAPPFDPLKMVSLLNASCLEPFRDCLSRILGDDSNEKEPVACLIADPMWEFATTVANGFNLPRIALRTGGVLAFLVYDSVPLLREKGYFPLQEARQEEPVPEFPPLKIKDLPSEEHHDLLTVMVKETKNYPQGIICNTFKELEGSVFDKLHQCLVPIPAFPIGPLHKYSPTNSTNSVMQDDSSITWLNTQAPNSVLYVSFGTLANISKEQFLEVAWGLANSKQPFLWVVRSSLVQGSEENPGFPEGFLETVAGRAHVVTWVPQQWVLAHKAVGGFWTHCGWNSTIESICEGVPMLCLPFFGDQTMNARHVCDVLRIGLQLEKGLERQEIERSIRTLMVGKEGEEMRGRVAALKEKADLCIMDGGSSHDSLDRLTNHILSFCSTEILKNSGTETFSE